MDGSAHFLTKVNPFNFTKRQRPINDEWEAITHDSYSMQSYSYVICERVVTKKNSVEIRILRGTFFSR